MILGMMMRRREFIAGLGGAAAWPTIGHAQRSAPPVIGYLGSSSPDTTLIAHFTRGLKEAGYIEGEKWRLCTASPKTKSIDCRN